MKAKTPSPIQPAKAKTPPKLETPVIYRKDFEKRYNKLDKLKTDIKTKIDNTDNPGKIEKLKGIKSNVNNNSTISRDFFPKIYKNPMPCVLVLRSTSIFHCGHGPCLALTGLGIWRRLYRRKFPLIALRKIRQSQARLPMPAKNGVLGPIETELQTFKGHRQGGVVENRQAGISVAKGEIEQVES